MSRYRYIYGKLRVAIAVLLASTIVFGAATYAWIVMSTAPEASNADVVLGANQALEIALATKEHLEALEANNMYDTVGWSTYHDSDIHINNTRWGNVVDLGDDVYGLQYITMKPVALNLLDNVIRQNPISTPEYGEDGRIGLMNTTSTYATFTPSSGIFEPAEDSDYGVRVIGRVADSGLVDRIIEKCEQVHLAYGELYDSFGSVPAELYLFQNENAEDYSLDKMREISLALTKFEDIFLDLTDLIDTAFPDALSEDYDTESYDSVLGTIAEWKELLKSIEDKYIDDTEEVPTEENSPLTVDEVKSLLDMFLVDPVFFYKTYVYDEELKKNVERWVEITDYDAQRTPIYEHLTIKGEFGKPAFYDYLYHLVGDELYSPKDGLTVNDNTQTLNYSNNAFYYNDPDYRYGRAGNVANQANSSVFESEINVVNTYNAAYNSYVAKLNRAMREDYAELLDFCVAHAENLEDNTGTAEELYLSDEWIGECRYIDSEGTGMLGRLSRVYNTLSEIYNYFNHSLIAIESSSVLNLTYEERLRLEDSKQSVSDLMGSVYEVFYSLHDEVYGYKYDEKGEVIKDSDGDPIVFYLGNDPEYPSYYQKSYDTMVSLWSSYLDLADVTINDIPVISFYENLEDNLIKEEPEEGEEEEKEDPNKIDYTVSFGGDSIFEQALAFVNDPVMVACVSGSEGILHDVDGAREKGKYKLYEIPETWEIEWKDMVVPEISAEDKTVVKLSYDPTYEVYPYYSWTRQLEYERETDREFVFRVVSHYVYRYEDAAEEAYQNAVISNAVLEAVKNQLIFDLTGAYQIEGYTEEELSDMADSLVTSVGALNSYLKYFNELLKMVASGEGTSRAQYEEFMAAPSIDEKLVALGITEEDPFYVTYYRVKNALDSMEAAATKMRELKAPTAPPVEETEPTEPTDSTESTEPTQSTEPTEPAEELLIGKVKAEEIADVLHLLVPNDVVLINGKPFAEFKPEEASGNISLEVPEGPYGAVLGVCGGGEKYSASLSASVLAKDTPGVPTSILIQGEDSPYTPGYKAWDGLASAPTDGQSTDANRTADYLLNDPYCFCVDMLFRTSEDGGVLQLQTDPKYRVSVNDEFDAENLDPELMGGGSFVECDNPEIYSALRFVFADTLTREVYATASADAEGKLRLDNRTHIIPLVHDRVEAITVWIYVDGERVTIDNFTTGGVDSLKVNLQFSTDITLNPAWNLLEEKADAPTQSVTTEPTEPSESSEPSEEP